VWNIHESEPWQTYFDFLPPAIAKKALEYFRDPYRVIFVADATRDAWSPLNSAHNFTVIHNGLDLQQLRTQAGGWTRASARRWLDVGEEEVVVLLLGTVCPRKGQHDLVLALRRLPQEVVARLRCFIVGDRPGEYSAQLSALVYGSEIELQRRIRLVAQTVVPEPKDVVPYYRAADIFVCTSRVESFPRVILEAMAYGLPIISTPVFGIREQIFENENGLFYEPGDVERLAELLGKLALSREERERLAGAGLDVLDMLPTVEEMADGYGQILREAYLSKGKQVPAFSARLEEVRTP
jgi:glycosyltransferase involved in cell wall biosynthesis